MNNSELIAMGRESLLSLQHSAQFDAKTYLNAGGRDFLDSVCVELEKYLNYKESVNPEYSYIAQSTACLLILAATEEQTFKVLTENLKFSGKSADICVKDSNEPRSLAGLNIIYHFISSISDDHNYCLDTQGVTAVIKHITDERNENLTSSLRVFNALKVMLKI